MNLEVEDGGDKTSSSTWARSDGATLFGKGHDDGADVTLSTDMETAKAVFVAGNPQAGMQAFMSGKVRVQGDMTKLMMAQRRRRQPRADRRPAGHHRVSGSATGTRRAVLGAPLRRGSTRTARDRSRPVVGDACCETSIGREQQPQRIRIARFGEHVGRAPARRWTRPQRTGRVPEPGRDGRRPVRRPARHPSHHVDAPPPASVRMWPDPEFPRDGP